MGGFTDVIKKQTEGSSPDLFMQEALKKAQKLWLILATGGKVGAPTSWLVFLYHSLSMYFLKWEPNSR